MDSRAGPRVGEDAAVEHPAGDDRHPSLEAGRQQLFQCDLVQQRVATGQQEAVEVGLLRKAGQHLRLVHAGADSTDHALLAQLIERAVGAAQRLVVVVVGVVDVQDVDPADGQALEALLERPHHAVIGEIEHWIERRGAVEHLAGLGRRIGAKKPADLGRERVVGARLLAQDPAEMALREAEAVEGSGVEEAQTFLPGPVDDLQRVGLADGAEQAAQGRRPQAKTRDHQPGPAKPDAFASFQLDGSARASPTVEDSMP